MSKETPTANYLRDKGFTVLVQKSNNVTLTTRLNGVLACMQDRNQFTSAVDGHKERIKGFYDRKDEEWCGGSTRDLLDDLEGRIDMRPFEKAREKFERSNLAKRLQERFEKCQPRRQRVKSEYDGEFNESRRWDIAPFDGIKKAPGFGRAIDVVVYGSVACTTSADELNRYGNLVWTLIDIIEKAGVNARVVTRYQQSGFLSGAGGKLTIDVESKKSGEYIAPSLLAATFKSNFFRRAIFQQICMGADVVNSQVSYGLGTPQDVSEKIQFKDGQLILSPEVRNAGFEQIERELLKVIE
jgi:hypothetical protein